MARLGQTLTEVLYQIWLSPARTKGDWARLYADEVAALAIDGLITTKIDKGTFSNIWRVTPDGLEALHVNRRMA